jgi:hypothetical protein
MRYDVEFAHPKQIDRRRAEQALAALPVVGTPERMRVILTGDMFQSLERHDERHDPRFTRSRTTGIVGAKTLHHRQGTATVLIDAGFFEGKLGDSGMDFLRRLVRHEGYHVVLGERNEDTDCVFRRLQPPEARGYCLGIGAIAVDEYRIERALWAEGYPDEGRAHDLSTILPEARQQFRDAVVMRYDREPIDRTMRSAVTVFNQLSTHMAYVAAEPAAVKTKGIAAVEHERDWERLIGTTWEEFERILQDVPDAREPSRERIDAAIEALAWQHEAWFAHIGFRFEEISSGTYFRVLRHDF